MFLYVLVSTLTTMEEEEEELRRVKDLELSISTQIMTLPGLATIQTPPRRAPPQRALILQWSLSLSPWRKEGDQS